MHSWHPGITLQPMMRSIARWRSGQRTTHREITTPHVYSSSTGRLWRRWRRFRTDSFAVFRDTGVAMAEHTLGDAESSQQALDRAYRHGGWRCRLSNR